MHVLKDIRKHLGMSLIIFSETKKKSTWYLNFTTKTSCYNKNVITEKSVNGEFIKIKCKTQGGIEILLLLMAILTSYHLRYIYIYNIYIQAIIYIYIYTYI